MYHYGTTDVSVPLSQHSNDGFDTGHISVLFWPVCPIELYVTAVWFHFPIKIYLLSRFGVWSNVHVKLITWVG